MSLSQLCIAAIIALLGIGIYCLISRRNLIQLVIGIEIIAKAICLSFIFAGHLQGNEQIAQAIVVTIVVIEAITAAVVMSLIVAAYRRTGSLDVKDFRRLKG